MASTSVTMTTNPSIPETQETYFHAIDYVVFAIMLLLSASIGVFFAVRDRRKRLVTTSDFLMASREMTYGPVALSLLASFMSSVTILGLPAEYYVYGTMFSWFGLVYMIIPFILIFIFLPVFYDLGTSSTYEYIELRFNRPTRLIVTCLYLILSALYGGIVTYGPALALSKVTGLHMWGSILCTGGVCIFYTSLGGLKAVIWTDVLQCILMISGFIIVIIQGSINLGGFGNVWESAKAGGRVDFIHFEVDPRIRHTFWTIMIGGMVIWTSLYGVNQSQVQRYVCCRSKRHATIAILINSVGLIVIMVLAGMTGLIIYATYVDCDPINNGDVDKSDQLFPFIVMDIVGHLRGIPGIFVSAVFSSSLSTISSGINAMACVTLEDFIRPATKWKEQNYTRIARIMVFLYGVLYILVAYLASEIGGLIRMSYSIHGIIGGPITGLFTLGMLLPWTNSHGAICGILAGMGSTIWIFIGSTIYPTSTEFTRPLPRSTAGCQDSTTRAEFNTTTPYNMSTWSYNSSEVLNADTPLSLEEERPAIASLYSLSYLHFATVGFVTTVLVGMLVSALTGCTKKNPPDDELLTPFLRAPEKSSDKNGQRNYSKVDGVERSMSWVSPNKLVIESPTKLQSAGTTSFFGREEIQGNLYENDNGFDKESCF